MINLKQLTLMTSCAIALIFINAEYHRIVQASDASMYITSIQLTGLLSLLLLTACMILSTKNRWIESKLRGLDKCYQLHRTFGISGLSFGIIHWVLYIANEEQDLNNSLQSNLDARNNILSNNVLPLFERFQYPAMEIGEKAIYIMLILFGVSLLSRIKYKVFKFSHKLMALSYLFIAFHSIVLIDETYWSHIISIIIIAISSIGSLIACYSLLGLIGRKNRFAAEITNLKYYPPTKSLEITLDHQNNFFNFKPGQFAYLKVNSEEAHPFTITSSPYDNKISFLIKELGDFTNDLYNKLKVGQRLQIEGPYGAINFANESPQIWIAGGVGIALFLSELKLITQNRKIDKRKIIYLYYCTHSQDSDFESLLEELCKSSNVALTIIHTTNSQRLDGEMLVYHHPNLERYQIYFCGPAKFSSSLRKDLTGIGIDTNNCYHTEAFSFR